MMHANANNAPRLTYLRAKKRQTIALIRQEAKLMASAFWSNLLEELSRERAVNMKAFWTRIKPILKKSGASRIAVTDTGDRHGEILTDVVEIEARFREEMRSKYTPPPPEYIDQATQQDTQDFHQRHPDLTTPLQLIDITRLPPGHELLKPFHPREVFNIFRTFKHKAPGEDSIRRIHIDHFPKSLIVTITKIFNYCLSTGYYPKQWKKGIMVVIPKPGKDPSNTKNYRPITLLDIIGKAFGKLINRRLVKHLEANGHLNPLQYGFRIGRGTESSLALTYEYACRKIRFQQSHKVAVVSRDISGAFDRLWHERLMVLIHERLGLPTLFTKLVCNFLVDRQVIIRIGNHLGPPFTPQAGVPQGAPDSPDLFNISTLPLGDLNYTPDCYAPWYADDLHLVVSTPLVEKTGADINAT